MFFFLLRVILQPLPKASTPDAQFRQVQQTSNFTMQLVQLVLLIGSAALGLLSAALVTYLRHHRYEAFKGDSDAARKLLLPAFEPLLWLVTSVNLLLTVAFGILLVLRVEFTQLPLVASECVYAAQQFVVLVVLVLLLQKSVSIPALGRTVVVALLLSTYTIFVVWGAHKLAQGPSDPADLQLNMGELVILLGRLLVFALYAFVLCHPPVRASKRTLREYCVFAAIYHVLLVASQETLHLRGREGREEKGEDDEKLQYALVCLSQGWGLLSPLATWRVLKADTEHWRGLGQSAYHQQQQQLRNAHTNHNSANATHIILERISSEGLHVLIEMHRKHVIDFAYLELRERIGVGASSTVFHGLLYSKIATAVKVYTPLEFTDDVVASFSHEAALCGSLHHPNIVKFYGMCVCPPTICLISERCQGSLDQVTKAMARRARIVLHPRHSYHHRQHQQVSTGERHEQLLIDLGFMLDAARSVAYLHSFSPAFVHRDVKPSNFLVDYRNNVKLTDFGESRCLPRAQMAPRNNNQSNRFVRSATVSSDDDAYTTTGDASRLVGSGSLSSPSSQLTSGFKVSRAPAQLTVKGTVDYMAPEIIQGRAGFAAYGEAVDIYALGVMFWDILYPLRDKFPQLNNNHLHIFQAVLDGKRPQFDTQASIHEELRHVIQMTWAQEPRSRPSAQYVVTLLERIQEHECARFAGSFRKQLLTQREGSVVRNLEVDFNTLSQTTTLTGAHAVKQLVELGAVRCPRQAIRLGNMLIDAGVLHHLKHSQPFDDSEDQLYFFDQYCIKLYDPIAILEDRSSSDSRAYPLERSDTAAVADTTKKQKKKASNRMFLRQWANHSNRTLFSRIAGLGSHDQPEQGEDEDPTVAAAGTIGSNEPGFRQCRCRKLSQRLEVPRESVRHKFRQKFRGAAVVLEETHALTTNLLIDDGCKDGDHRDGDDDELLAPDAAAVVNANESALRKVAAKSTAPAMQKRRMVRFAAPGFLVQCPQQSTRTTEEAGGNKEERGGQSDDGL